MRLHSKDGILTPTVGIGGWRWKGQGHWPCRLPHSAPRRVGWGSLALPPLTALGGAQPAPSAAAHGRAGPGQVSSRPPSKAPPSPARRGRHEAAAPPAAPTRSGGDAPPQRPGDRNGPRAGAAGLLRAPVGRDGAGDPALPLPNCPGSGGSAGEPGQCRGAARGRSPRRLSQPRRGAAGGSTAVNGRRGAARDRPTAAAVPAAAAAVSSAGSAPHLTARPGPGRRRPAPSRPSPRGHRGLAWVPAPGTGAAEGGPGALSLGRPVWSPRPPEREAAGFYLFKEISPRSRWSKLMQNKCLPLIDWFF